MESLPKIGPEFIQRKFAKSNINISLEEARLILDLLNKLANIAVTQLMRHEGSRSIH